MAHVPAARVKPTLNSPELNKILSETAPVFAKYAADIDAISNDIRAIEQWLRAQAIGVPFYMECKGCSIDTFDFDAKHTLAWIEDEESEEFRLMYQHWEKNDLKLERPLISTRLPVRIALYPYLAQFLKELAQVVYLHPVLEKPQDQKPKLVTSRMLNGEDAELSYRSEDIPF